MNDDDDDEGPSTLAKDLTATPEPAAPRRRGRRTDSQPQPQSYARIILDNNDNIPPSGQFIGVNGVGYLVQPGVEVVVPIAVLDILRNAVMAVPQLDPQTQQVVGYRERLRFPFQVLGYEDKPA